VHLFRFSVELFYFGFRVLPHVSLLSRCTPRYFTLFFWGRSILPICTVGQVWERRVNVFGLDFVLFILIFHFVHFFVFHKMLRIS
jgi:hypothetical protein